MPCYAPLKGYKGVNGGISWTPSAAYVDVPMAVPCGQCVGCRLERSRQWGVRMMHEAQMHSDNCFLTLTYDDEHLPWRASLQKRDFVLFMKKLREWRKRRCECKDWDEESRKLCAKHLVSFFHCGEYGEINWRPHYHAMLFGHDFRDRKLYTRNHQEQGIYTSESLSALWGLGLATVGNCSFESASYIARYVVKKVIGQKAEDHYRRVDPKTGEIYELVPEYATMSLKPAIGKRWFEEFGGDVVKYDGVVVAGQLTRPPRYYDSLRQEEELAKVKRKRVFKSLENYANNTDARLKVREEVRLSRLATGGIKRRI